MEGWRPPSKSSFVLSRALIARRLIFFVGLITIVVMTLSTFVNELIIRDASKLMSGVRIVCSRLDYNKLYELPNDGQQMPTWVIRPDHKALVLGILLAIY